MAIKYTYYAADDLNQILSYINSKNPCVVKNIGKKIKKAIGRLQGNPGMGKAGRVYGTRELIISNTPYIVVYRVTSDIEILRILHGASRTFIIY